MNEWFYSTDELVVTAFLLGVVVGCIIHRGCWTGRWTIWP